MSQKKNEQLGMPFGTANARLRKNILFSLLARYGENICYQCGEMITSVDQLSIEHKIPWLDNDPKLFWDLDNIAFSHLSCNVSAAIRPSLQGKPNYKNRKFTENTAYCPMCGKHLPKSEFYSNKARHSKIANTCKQCIRSYKKRAVVSKLE